MNSQFFKKVNFLWELVCGLPVSNCTVQTLVLLKEEKHLSKAILISSNLYTANRFKNETVSCYAI